MTLYFGLKALLNTDKGEVHIFHDEIFLARLSTGDIHDIARHIKQQEELS